MAFYRGLTRIDTSQAPDRELSRKRTSAVRVLRRGCRANRPSKLGVNPHIVSERILECHRSVFETFSQQLREGGAFRTVASRLRRQAKVRQTRFHWALVTCKDRPDYAAVTYTDKQGTSRFRGMVTRLAEGNFAYLQPSEKDEKKRKTKPVPAKRPKHKPACQSRQPEVKANPRPKRQPTRRQYPVIEEHRELLGVWLMAVLCKSSGTLDGFHQKLRERGLFLDYLRCGERYTLSLHGSKQGPRSRFSGTLAELGTMLATMTLQRQ